MPERLQVEAEIAARDAATPELARAGRGFQDLGSILDRFVVTAGDVVNAFDAVGEGIRQNLQVQTQVRLFEEDLASAGGSIEEFQARVRGATRGTVSELDATVNGVRALRLGLVEAQLPELFGVAAARAEVFGITTQQALSDITRGIARLSPRILDNIGFTVDLADAYEAYARTIGKTTEELTKLEQQQAVAAVVLQQGVDATREVAAAQSEANVALQRGSALYEDAKAGVTAWALSLVDAAADTLRVNEALDLLEKRLRDTSTVSEGFADRMATTGRSLREVQLELLGMLDPFERSQRLIAANADALENQLIRALAKLQVEEKGVAEETEALLDAISAVGVTAIPEARDNIEALNLRLDRLASLQRDGVLSWESYQAAVEKTNREIEANQAVLDGTATSVQEFMRAQDRVAPAVDRVSEALDREAAAAERTTLALERQSRQLAFTAGEFDRIAAAAGRAAAAQAAVEAGGRQFGNRVFLPGGGARFVTEPGFGSQTFPTTIGGGRFTTIL